MEIIKSDLKIEESLEILKNLQLNGNEYIHGNLEINGSISGNSLSIASTLKTKGKNLGIGTTTPAYSVDIVGEKGAGLLLSSKAIGDASIRLFTERKDFSKTFWNGTAGSGNKGWMISAINENSTSSDERVRGDLRIYYHDDTQWKQALAIDKNSMNLGIGTTIPAHSVDIVRKNNVGLLLSSKTTGDASIRLFTERKDLSKTFWSKTKGSGNKGWMIWAVNENNSTTDKKVRGDLRIYYHDDVKWHQAMSIDKRSRNMGLGTNTPESRLHIKGRLTLENTGNSRGWIVMKGAANNNTASKLLDTLKPHQLIIGGAWNDYMYFYWKNTAGNKLIARIKGSSF